MNVEVKNEEEIFNKNKKIQDYPYSPETTGFNW